MAPKYTWKDPEIAAILKFFPGAEIRDVRVRAETETTDTAESDAPDAAMNEDGDVLPEDDIDE